MRRTVAVLTVLFVIIGLALCVHADTSASSFQNQTVVAMDGTCQVSLNVRIHLETGVNELSFYLPGNARNITVNGGNARVSRSGSFQSVDLVRYINGFTGDFDFIIFYTLPNAVQYDKDERLMLTLPLLSGFSYPVDEMRFSITLPADITGYPAFTSAYFQNSIESGIDYTIDGAVISGEVHQELKDRETLTMTLAVSEEVFPQEDDTQWQAGMDDVALYVCAGAAALYWLVFLRCLPPKRVRRAIPPEGVTAGMMGSVLTGQGQDLTMMVMTWAQLGYILVHLDRHGRVILHKRMDMGNERSAFEVRCFRSLFGKRQMVDGTGNAYAQLHFQIGNQKPDVRAWFYPGSGNTKILRFLAAGMGAFGGMSLGRSMAGSSLLAIPVLLIMLVLGAVIAWHIQGGAYCLFLRDKQKLWVSLSCCVVFMVLGVIAGDLAVAAEVVAGQWLFGMAAAYSGRRNELGRQTMSETLGLRRYLRTASRQELQRFCQADPDYFFSLAPYALALGADKAFAGRFGSMRLPNCPYLTTGMDGHRTAREWMELMRQAVSAMDAKAKQIPYERMMSRGLSMGAELSLARQKMRTRRSKSRTSSRSASRSRRR